MAMFPDQKLAAEEVNQAFRDAVVFDFPTFTTTAATNISIEKSSSTCYIPKAQLNAAPPKSIPVAERPSGVRKLQGFDE